MALQASLIVTVVFVGMLAAVQGPLNARLGSYLVHPLQASFFSFLGGLTTVTILTLLLARPLPSWQRLGGVPYYLFGGGLLGAAFVITMILLVPRLGAAVCVSAFVVGQLACSVLIDHYGLLGLPVSPATPRRLLGIALLAAGVLLVQRKGSL